MDCTQASAITDRFLFNRTDTGDFLYLKRLPLSSQSYQLIASTKSGVKASTPIGLAVCGSEVISVDSTYVSVTSDFTF